MLGDEERQSTQHEKGEAKKSVMPICAISASFAIAELRDELLRNRRRKYPSTNPRRAMKFEVR
jgi:hypothetical protein